MDFIHNGALIAIVAHGLIGASLVWDKVLLRQPETRNLLSYVFWLGAMSVFGLVLIAFGFHLPPLPVAGLAVVSGALHLAAVGFYYAALKAGEASETLAVVGGFSPLATALIAVPLLKNPVGGKLLAFTLLTAGGFVMFWSEGTAFLRLLPRILLSSGLFGLTNVLQKMVFDHTDFISGYVFFTFGTFLASLALLMRGSWRRQIFEASEEASPRSRLRYFVNRFGSGVGSFLIFYAISLESPAIVDAITGVRYVLIFLGALLLTKLKPEWLSESFGAWNVFWKTLSTLLVVAGLVMLGLESDDAGVAG